MFGDWRLNDTSLITFTRISDLAEFNAVKDTVRGNFTNKDTGWRDITVGRQGIDDTISHTGEKRISEKTLSQIKALIENSVLLDSEISDNTKSKKHPNTLFMHKLYAQLEYKGQGYIAKLSIEEYCDNKNIRRRFYSLQDIKMSPSAVDFSSNEHPNQIAPLGDNISVAVFSKFVKRLDKNYNPHEVSKVVNSDGIPKVVYHGTNTEFNVFESKSGVHFFFESFDYIESMMEERSGDRMVRAYLSMKRPYEVSLNGRQFSDPTVKKSILIMQKLMDMMVLYSEQILLWTNMLPMYSMPYSSPIIGTKKP